MFQKQKNRGEESNSFLNFILVYNVVSFFCRIINKMLNSENSDKVMGSTNQVCIHSTVY